MLHPATYRPCPACSSEQASRIVTCSYDGNDVAAIKALHMNCNRGKNRLEKESNSKRPIWISATGGWLLEERGLRKRLIEAVRYGVRHLDHINYFMPDSLARMVKQTGFTLKITNPLTLHLDDNINAPLSPTSA